MVDARALIERDPEVRAALADDGMLRLLADESTPSIELFAREVMPVLKARTAVPA